MFLVAVCIYVLVSFSLGALIIWLYSDYFRAIQIISSFMENYVLTDLYSGIAFAWTGLLIILSCLVFVKRLFKGVRREKSINFQTPEGMVRISLSAIEDMVKKMLQGKKEFVHIKPRVKVNRKGIEVLIKGALNCEVNLAEFSTAIQAKVKKKIEEMLNEQGEVKVSLEIKKFAFAAKKNLIDVEPEVPYRNY